MPTTNQTLDDVARQIQIDPDSLHDRIDKLLNVDRQRYARLSAYYRNPMRLGSAYGSDDAGSDRPYRQAQEWGLPSRITGVRSGGDIDSVGLPILGIGRKEVVIENDIGWRVETMNDYLFGKPIVIESAAPDPDRRREIGALLRMILARSGGILFLQQLASVGSVYGFVDVLVKFDADGATCGDDVSPTPSCATQSVGQPPPQCDHTKQPAQDAQDEPTPDAHAPSGYAEPARGVDDSTLRDPGASNTTSPDATLERIARMVRLEIVEPARALPLLSPRDWRTVDAYAQCYEIPRSSCQRDDDASRSAGWFGRFLRNRNGRFARSRVVRFANPRRADRVVSIELITPSAWQTFEDERVVASGANSLGRIPLVHIQNTAVAMEYSGASDVEPLIPLQDELNTRLSDRAYRITLQSFRMYLGKGIENFASLAVAPGRMWTTDNPDANVIEFGGDASCPSEDAHIGELREALDKTSGVTPIAAGAIKGRIGRLTSAAALRVTMLALLAKTEKKRTTYGAGIERMCELALAWLDRAGVFPTTSDERRVELHWPSPLPENEMEKLQEAQIKSQLGVPQQIVLRELGY